MQGNIAEIAIGLQASKGTAATSAQHRMRISGGGFAEMREVRDIEESSGGILIEAAFVASVRGEGAPEFIVRPSFIALLAYAALGKKTTTGAGDPWSHALDLVDVAPFALPRLTTWAQLADGRYVRVVDCKVAKLRFESEANGLLKATTTIIGASPVSRTSATYTTDMGAVAVEKTDAFLHADAKGGLQVEGSAVSALERCAVEIDNGATAQYGDAVTPDDISQARRTIAVETTQIISDFSLFNRLHYGSASPTSGTVPTRDVLELAGSPAGIAWQYTRPGTPERSIQFLAPRLVVAELGGLEFNAAGEPIKQQATYRAYQPASGSGLSVVVKNGIADYPALP